MYLYTIHIHTYIYIYIYIRSTTCTTYTHHRAYLRGQESTANIYTYTPIITLFWLDTVNIYWWWCINSWRVRRTSRSWPRRGRTAFGKGQMPRFSSESSFCTLKCGWLFSFAICCIAFCKENFYREFCVELSSFLGKIYFAEYEFGYFIVWYIMVPFSRRNFLGTPVNLILPSPKWQGVPSSPTCRNSLLLQRPHSCWPHLSATKACSSSSTASPCRRRPRSSRHRFFRLSFAYVFSFSCFFMMLYDVFCCCLYVFFCRART